MLQITWRYVGKEKFCTITGKEYQVMCIDDVYCVHLLFCQVYFGMIDALVAKEELPEEYKGRKQVMTLDHLC
jgi:hypothetical protein